MPSTTRVRGRHDGVGAIVMIGRAHQSTVDSTAFPHTQQRKTRSPVLSTMPAASGVERMSTASTRIASDPNRTQAVTFGCGRG